MAVHPSSPRASGLSADISIILDSLVLPPQTPQTYASLVKSTTSRFRNSSRRRAHPNFALTKSPYIQIPTLHFVFGYGSLINPVSVSKTLPNPPLSVRPCSVRGLARAWNYNCNDTYTAVGVDPVDHPGAQTNGVLLHLPDPSDLPLLDVREKCYKRKQIQLSHINGVQLPSNACVWVYVNPPTEMSHMPTRNVPIPQTYIDCILTGCLKISKAFAEEFVRSTDGWEGHWVDDRKSREPRYKRKDGAPRDPWDDIDRVLKSHLPEHLWTSRVVELSRQDTARTL